MLRFMGWKRFLAWEWGRWHWRLQSAWMDIRRFIFLRIIPVAIECDGCGRLMPVEFKKLAHHLRFRGRKHTQIVLCDNCDGRESILDGFYDDEDGFDDDEWRDQEREISETSSSRYLVILPDGRLGLSEVSGYKYWGQDWGETVDQWDEDAFPLLRTRRPFLRVLVRALKEKRIDMPTKDKSVDISWFDEDYYDEEDADPEYGGLHNASV